MGIRKTLQAKPPKPNPPSQTRTNPEEKRIKDQRGIHIHNQITQHPTQKQRKSPNHKSLNIKYIIRKGEAYIQGLFLFYGIPLRLWIESHKGTSIKNVNQLD